MLACSKSYPKAILHSLKTSEDKFLSNRPSVAFLLNISLISGSSNIRV